ncbi:MAG: DNA repair protein RadC [Spirochaetales bacterium]|nr:DNA repair protein RadC [Spirochaetales bacterium]
MAEINKSIDNHIGSFKQSERIVRLKELDKYSVSELREALYARAPVKGLKIRYPHDIVIHLASYAVESQEYFLVITLNGAHEVIAVHEISKGIVNRAIVHPREVFRAAIADNAAAVIISHNHPSGNVDPSPEDRSITNTLVSAGKIICIEVLDHVILGAETYYSFQENGILSS